MAERTRVIRVTESSYQTMRSLKQRTEKRNAEKLTYSQYLDEMNKIAELLLDGQEVYFVDGIVYSDQGEAWGAAVLLTAQGHETKPEVYLYLGEDDSFTLPEGT